MTDILVEPHVRPEDFLYTKFVTTVIVIVPVTAQEDFMANVDLVSDYVVPLSAKKFKVPEKDGLALWYNFWLNIHRKVNIFTQKV